MSIVYIRLNEDMEGTLMSWWYPQQHHQKGHVVSRSRQLWMPYTPRTVGFYMETLKIRVARATFLKWGFQSLNKWSFTSSHVSWETTFEWILYVHLYCSSPGWISKAKHCVQSWWILYICTAPHQGGSAKHCIVCKGSYLLNEASGVNSICS